MDESQLKSQLVKEFKRLLPQYVVLRHEDMRTSGIPDISATGRGRTTWLEVKFANPEFKSHGIQELTMLRLDKAGYARYVVYEVTSSGAKWTHIFKPSDMKRDMWTSVEGIDHSFVIGRVEEHHW